MADLGLIWGFLKYYHPSIAAGNYNWDYELFRILPKILNAKTTIHRDKALVKWIVSLGKISENKENLEEGLEIKIKPDLDWINNSGFSNELSSLLTKVKNANRTKHNYYADYELAGGYPEFKNEKPYRDMIYPDAGFRLLALYRYWNIIQYYFPYKYLTEDNWQDILYEFIPQLIDANNELEYRLTLKKLTTRTQDTHAFMYDKIMEENKGLRLAPYEITFIEDKAVIKDIYKPIDLSTNIRKGDIIAKINNQSVDSIIKQMIPYTEGSNYPIQLRNIARDLLRTKEEKLFIEYKRDGMIFSDSIFCPLMDDLEIPDLSQKNKPLIEKMNNITYLYLGSTQGGTVPSTIETKGLIIDLRCYPNLETIQNFWEYNALFPGPTEFAKFTFSHPKQPGTFFFTNPIKTGVNNPDYYKGKKVILINEITQSRGEFIAMKYRCAPNTIVIGSITAGTDGNVFSFFFPGGIYTSITGLGVYYPDGTETQQIGIMPDIEIKPTIQGIREGRDEILEKAIEYIENE